jgi:hypothetical protein
MFCNHAKTTMKENDLTTAMSHELLECFFGGGGEGDLVDFEKGIGACPEHEIWIGMVVTP